MNIPLDGVSLLWGVLVWLVGITAVGGFFLGRLFEKVTSHSRRIQATEEEMAEIRKEQSQLAQAFAAMKSKLDETHRYSVAIWRKLTDRRAA